MNEVDRAKLEAISNQLVDVCRRVAALERIAKKAKEASECAKVWAIIAAVMVLVIVAVVAILLFGNCFATECWPSG